MIKIGREIKFILLFSFIVIGLIVSYGGSASYAASAADTLKIGNYIQFGRYNGEPILWRIINKSNDGSVMLFSERILCLKAFDAYGDDVDYNLDGKKDTHDSNRRQKGSNYWERSNIREWLNSSGKAVKYSHQAPDNKHVQNGNNAYVSEPGFLYNFTEAERGMIKNTSHKVLVSKTDKGVSNGGSEIFKTNIAIGSVLQNYKKSFYKTVTDSVFLLDVKDLYDNVYKKKFNYCKMPTQKAAANSTYKSGVLSNSTKWWYWTGTPNADSSSIVRTVNDDALIDNTVDAYHGTGGVAPALWVKTGSMTLTGSGKIDNPYALADNSIMTSKDIMKKYGGAVVYIEIQNSNHKAIASGSGFIISSDGKVVTNYHVIEGAAYITVTLSNGSKFDVEGVSNYNINQDIAILKLKNARNLQFVKLGNSDKIEVGDNVVAIGSPQGLENSLSTGIISGLDRDNGRGYKDIQTTASIASGSSGGALFNTKGEVIGITYLGYESSGDLGFAIPINEVKPLINSSNANGSSGVKSLPPTGLKITATDNQIFIQWNPVDKVDGYHIYVSLDQVHWECFEDKKGKKQLYTDCTVPQNIDSIKDGTTFYFKVTSAKNGKESAYSAVVSWTKSSKPKVPTNVKAWYAKDKVVHINWNPVDGVDGYYCYYSFDQENWYYWEDDKGYKRLLKWYSDYSASLTLSPNDNENEVIYFRVSSVKNGVESDYSAIITVTKLQSKPQTPTGVKVWTTPDNKMKIQWNPVDKVDGYYIYISMDNSNWQCFTSNSGDKVLIENDSYSEDTSSVKAGQTYYFKITAVKGEFESDYSPVVSWTK